VAFGSGRCANTRFLKPNFKCAGVRFDGNAAERWALAGWTRGILAITKGRVTGFDSDAELPPNHRPSGRGPRKVPLLAGLASVLAIGLAVVLVYPGLHKAHHTTPTADEHILVGVGVAPSAAGAASPTPSPSASAPPSTHTSTPKSARTTAKPPAQTNTRSGGRPGSGNTGPIAGTPLTTVNGDQVYSTPGQVIQNVDIHGYVRITAKNVTISNAIVRGGAAKCNAAVIDVEGGSATIQDTEIAPTNPNACLDGVWATDVTLLRMNIHGTVDGIKADDNTTVQDSWIHDLTPFASDPNQGGGPTHNDAIQTLGGTNILVKHNAMNPGKDGNAAYQVTQDFGKVGTITITGNFVDGGGCTLNLSSKGGGPMGGVSVTSNRFGRGSEFNCPILISTQTTLAANSGNVYDDTGAPIPKPQQHD
jgi:hypothetical protein